MNSAEATPTSNPAEPPSPSGPAPGLVPSAPPPPARRSSRWVVVGAVVVVVLLVLILGLVGVLPIFPSSNSSSNPTGGLTYDQALPIANSAAQGTTGGSWALVVSSGIVSSVSASENLSTPGSSGCNLTTLPGVSNTITLPAGPSNHTVGLSTSWLFLYRNAAGEMLLVVVFDGQASAIATIAAGQSCSTIFGLLSVIPSNVIDSSAVASDVQSDAASFLAAHPGADADYSLIGGISFLGHGIGAEWEVNYTTCPVDASPGTTGTSFNATVSATTGAVLYQQTLPLIDCSSTATVNLAHGGTPVPSLERLPAVSVARKS